MDLFEEYLQKQDNQYVNQALTDSSYQAYINRGKSKQSKILVNTNMATYGDAILKMILAGMLWDTIEKPTVEKARLESDLILVEVIGRNYNIAERMHYDKSDTNLEKDYDYFSDENSKEKEKTNNHHNILPPVWKR